MSLRWSRVSEASSANLGLKLLELLDARPELLIESDSLSHSKLDLSQLYNKAGGRHSEFEGDLLEDWYQIEPCS